ncbi:MULTISPECIES: ABC transporter ATP-binding protein [Thalassospira]|uniref:ABC transporter ATP-binding protein n=1 Tax=Thalassospira aquimaris TaxID=3037796 RepID=A0ABT6GGZ3_9PROT|nr:MULTISPECIES: ABC transporter ATP-binding protein [Thalassospira]MDG4721357.1 ABC transporter ATP-binding protein [Thalassospira sp. FZY0004]
MLSAQDLVVSYGKLPVLNGLSVRFDAGGVTALVGPNGCGKSTLLKSILGLMPKSGGSITLDDVPIESIPRRKLASRIAYLPQENHCPDYIVLGELIELAGYARYSLFGGPRAKDRALFRDVLQTVGLADMAHVPVNSLSGGQRQRAWIAMVLAQDADIILMDEPVNHLDMKYQYAVLDLVRTLGRDQGKTVIAVLHDLNLASAFADKVVMVSNGQATFSGPTQEVITPENIRTVFDFEADVFARNGQIVCLPSRGGALQAEAQ